MKIYEVGGMVRDSLMGRKSSDLDYTVEAESFAAMVTELEATGYTIFQTREKFSTVKAKQPNGGQTADFVLARKEGFYSDGRHPDEVEMGTLFDDLARRDFTMNAIARDEEGEFIDPFKGRRDITAKIIRAVGDPKTRILEDPLRALRALRFSITLGFEIENKLWRVLATPEVADKLDTVSTERVREELTKMFKVDTLETLVLLSEFSMIRDVALGQGSGLWLKPTTEKR